MAVRFGPRGARRFTCSLTASRRGPRSVSRSACVAMTARRRRERAEEVGDAAAGGEKRPEFACRNRICKERVNIEAPFSAVQYFFRRTEFALLENNARKSGVYTVS